MSSSNTPYSRRRDGHSSSTNNNQLSEYSRRSTDRRSNSGDIRSNNPYSRRSQDEYRDRGRERTVGDSNDTRYDTNRHDASVRNDGFSRHDGPRYDPRYRDAPRGRDQEYERRDSPRGTKREGSYEQRESYRPKQPRFQREYQERDDRDRFQRHTQPRSNGRYEKYEPRREPGKDHYQPKQTELAPEVELEKVNSRLKELESVASLSEIKVIDSRWGVKPKGFEQVSAQRAKLSGLFPLPGFPRPVDFTKLEGLIKDRLSSGDDILVEHSKIDPIDSRDSKTLIIKNDLTQIDYLKIVEFFNDYLKVIDLDSTGDNNIHTKRKTKDDKVLIIEFNNSECATIIYSLNEMELLFNAYKQEAIERKPEGEKFKLLISRPREYLVQNAPVPQSEKIEETVKDSPRKMSLVVSPNISSEEICEELEKVHPLKAMQFLTQRGTNDSLGLVFVEFSVDEKDSLEKQVPQLQTYLKQVSHISFVQNAFFSCIIPNQTDIQTCSVEYDTLKPLVRNEFVQSHSKSKVIQLLNCVTLQELNDETSYKFIQQDIKQEALKFGNVVSIKIPRPEHGGDFFVETRRGLGKVFIEFEDYDVALKAILGLAGRSYNDRTVLGSFYDYEDYKHGLL